MSNSNHKEIDITYKHIVEQKTTKELLRIYQYDYLNYQEEFVDLCEAELRLRKVNTGIKKIISHFFSMMIFPHVLL